MTGLLLKDLYNLRKYGKTVFLISAFFVMIMLMMGNNTIFASMIALMFSITSVTSFAYDKQSGWDVYVNTLPVSRTDVVLSKYVLSVLLALTGGVISLLVGWVNGIIKNLSNFTDTLVLAYTLFAIGVIFISILLPVIYKFGEERSRVILLAIIAIPVTAFFVLNETGHLAAPDEQTVRQALLLSPLVLIVVSVVSFMISRSIFGKKEV